MQNDMVELYASEEKNFNVRSPDWNNFWAIPTKSPHLRDFISSVVWNCANKSLTFEMSETPSFSAYNWFSKLAEDDAIAICFFDRNDQEVTRLMFNKLELVNHKCVMNKEEIDCENNELIHELALSYANVDKFDNEFTVEDWEISNSEIILAENA